MIDEITRPTMSMARGAMRPETKRLVDKRRFLRLVIVLVHVVADPDEFAGISTRNDGLGH
jgi:hypothetical protein